MEFSGVLSSDAPDPAVESEDRLRKVFFPVMELLPQPAISRLPIAGFSETRGAAGVEESSVLLSYTLWRFPHDRADPRNEIEMDEATRDALEEEPAWERPPWLIEQTRLFRYPMLWEAVRTSWYPSISHPSVALSTQIIQHANHVRRNVFRRELDVPVGAGGDHSWELDNTSVTPGTVTVDGHPHEGAQIQSHPRIYAAGYCVNEHVICTTVISRDALPYLYLELTTLTH